MPYYEGNHYIVTGIGTNGFIVSGYPISESTGQRVSTIVNLISEKENEQRNKRLQFPA